MIYVLGSINADLVFSVDHLPTRGETVLTDGSDMFPGGKGANQAAAAAKAGGRTVFVGCIGMDAFGPVVRGVLEESGCDVTHLQPVALPTGTAAVIVERSGENQIVVASGANRAVTAEMIPSDALGPRDTLVCQMEIPAEETAKALIRAKERGARTILNLAPASEISDAALDATDVLVVNTIEARVLVPDLEQPEDLARELARRHNLSCVVTLGADGAIAISSDGDGVRIPALAITPVDTVGAGDAFVGVLAASLDQGHALFQACRMATVAAALACTKDGAMTGHPKAEEIQDRLPDLADGPRLAAV